MMPGSMRQKEHRNLKQMYSCIHDKVFESEGMHEVIQCVHQCNALSVMEERFHKGLKNKKRII